MGLHSIGAGGGEPRRLSTDKATYAFLHAFHGGIACNRYGPDGSLEVWRFLLDGSEARSLTPGWVAHIRDVSRDGIVIVRKADPRELFVVDPRGAAPRSLGEKAESGLFSPDGSRILISRTVTGRRRARSRPLRGRARGRRPSGRELPAPGAIGGAEHGSPTAAP